MRITSAKKPLIAASILVASGIFAAERHPGSAVVTVADAEYLIPIDCYEASRPEMGFSTEPSRITRKATGRSSMISLIVRPWKETEHLIVSLDRYVAWIEPPQSSGGTLEITLDMSPMSFTKDGSQTLMTYEIWMDGERPEGIRDVKFIANCVERDPDAPAYRKLPAN